MGVSGGDPALGMATLEVSLNNTILEAGFEIICSPTAEPENVEVVRKTLQGCQVELHPFFVYGHDGKAGLIEPPGKNTWFGPAGILFRKEGRLVIRIQCLLGLVYRYPNLGGSTYFYVHLKEY